MNFSQEYTSAGYKIFPCKRKSKEPANSNGSAGATKDYLEYSYEHRNIAIATGNGLYIVDVDNVEELGSELWDKLIETGAPTVKTANGFHFYFKSKESIKNSVKKIPGIDIRGEGGYVLAPPSIHPSGEKYTWCDLIKPVDELPDFPSWLLEMLNSLNNTYKPQSNPEGRIKEGGRNAYLTSLAGGMRKRGASQESIEAALLAENESNLEIPLSDKEVLNIARSVSRYTPEFKQEFKSSVNSLIRASELSNKTIEYLKDKKKVKGLPTGIEGLDKMLGGGKRLGEVTCWHAEAKTGKNTLWHFMQWIMLEQGIPIAYASRELSPEEEVNPNLMSVAFGENAWLKDMTGETIDKYKNKLEGWPLYYSEGYGYFPLDQIKQWIEDGIKVGIQYFWFDHLHYMLEDPEEHKMASKLIKEIKTIAKEKNIHIDIIIQPNKLADGQRLSLNSIKGGAAMGQAIDNLLILERMKDNKNIVKLTLDVARSKLARPGSLYLQFDPETTRFGETEPIEQSEEILTINTKPQITNGFNTVF